MFVGNLAFSTRDDSLRRAFEKFGEITNIKVAIDRDGRSKGFGFVEFATHKEAQKALDAMNGADVDGRAIRANFSGGKPEGNAPNGGGF